MDKEKLKELAESPEFISGIYNYCDRWCERCQFTSRCMNFALGEEEFEDPETRDINNRAFWDKLHDIFKVTMEMIKEMAEQEGIDLDSIDIEEETEMERLNSENAEKHPCSLAAKEYADMVDCWFDSIEKELTEGEDDISSNVQWNLLEAGFAVTEDGTDIGEMIDVIRWYQHQIYVKLMRAFHGQRDELNEIADEFPKDSDGSAKVSLMGIDRSMAAWTEMMCYLKKHKTEISGMFFHLEGLRSSVEKVFPDAREFDRPGFDDINQYPGIGNT